MAESVEPPAPKVEVERDLPPAATVVVRKPKVGAAPVVGVSLSLAGGLFIAHELVIARPGWMPGWGAGLVQSPNPVDPLVILAGAGLVTAGALTFHFGGEGVGF